MSYPRTPFGLYQRLRMRRHDQKRPLAEVRKAGIVRGSSMQARQERAQKIIEGLVEVHSKLVGLPDLYPRETTNEIFSSLVLLCSEVHDAQTIEQVLQSHETQSLLPSLRSICSEAESCLETHWAKYIAEPSNPEEVFQRLRGFPYYTNYEDLTRLEICALLTVEPTLPKKIAFIGSGPLPLTSLCLLKALRNGVLPSNEPAEFSYPVEHISDVKVLNIDHCDAAIAVSSALSMKLGPRAQGMEFVCASGASEAQDLQEFDVVYLAALAGTSQAGKEDLLISVSARMRPGALLVVRTSWGLRSCLYPEVDMTTEKLRQWMDICVVVHPYGTVVNSVIIAKVRPTMQATI